MSQERRRYRRVQAMLLVERHEEGATFFDTTWNVSLGGLFMLRPKGFPVPNDLELSVHLPDGAPPIRTKGRVVRQVEGNVPRTGCGVEFMSLSESQSLRLSHFVESKAA